MASAAFNYEPKLVELDGEFLDWVTVISTYFRTAGWDSV